MIWNTDNPYLNIRLTGDNRIFMGGRDERFSVRTSRELYRKKALQLCEDFDKQRIPTTRWVLAETGSHLM
jgi:hypothetical protein